MTTESNSERAGDGAPSVLTRYQPHVAGAIAIAIVLAILLALESISVPLETGEILREAGGQAIVGGEQTYTAYSGLWLGVRALLGAYIVFVAVLISALAFSTWKEVLA